jgi:hypothetical protein
LAISSPLADIGSGETSGIFRRGTEIRHYPVPGTRISKRQRFLAGMPLRQSSPRRLEIDPRPLRASPGQCARFGERPRRDSVQPFVPRPSHGRTFLFQDLRIFGAGIHVIPSKQNGTLCLEGAVLLSSS